MLQITFPRKTDTAQLDANIQTNTEEKKIKISSIIYVQMGKNETLQI